MIDKFNGDGLMLVFGITNGNSGSADALVCVLDMLQATRPLYERCEKEGFPPITIGIGIHIGFVVAGEICVKRRLQYTVIGNTVNTTARLESATKDRPENCLPIIMLEDTAVISGLVLKNHKNAIRLI